MDPTTGLAWALISFCILVFCFLGIPPIFAWAAGKIRMVALARLARKYTLDFSAKLDIPCPDCDRTIFRLKLYDGSGKRNVMKGTVGNHKIEIFDERTLETDPAGISFYPKKTTTVIVDGLKKEIDGYASVRLLDTIIADLKYRNEVFTIFSRKPFDTVLILYVLGALAFIVFFVAVYIYSR